MEGKLMMNLKHLPMRPKEIEVLRKGEVADAFVIGGISLIGKNWEVCPTVTLFRANKQDYFGWSKIIGYPESENDEMYHFSYKEDTHRKAEIPNCITYFNGRIIDLSLFQKDANKEKINEIFAYVFPFVYNQGPLPPHPIDRLNFLKNYH